ncbi:hypothetical protein DYU05_17960 [Mucilaginibacter terrenus]|uniref:Uncharacterized protein n=1 Tax=Mucilaginibacter terrenus TaxID=2482727 RepID=A0A3E2NL37_9SPHI|nr:hypothetical protein DYU05_17960 [Mucilaginibacter terrenus]
MKHLALILLLLINTAFKPADVISTRFNPPAGYHRVAAPAGSFGAYLQSLPLKPAGTQTKTYKGATVRTDAYTAAVVDLSIGTQDLQQCADAVIRLRAEYLYKQNNYKAIAFNFTSGFKCDFVHYADGYRYSSERWVKNGQRLQLRQLYALPNPGI